MPTRGECCGCRKAPVQRYRFNVTIEDVASQRKLTQLLCRDCTDTLVVGLMRQCVERTPQRELDDLRAGVPLPDGSPISSSNAT
jgi:hypothetical protein